MTVNNLRKQTKDDQVIATAKALIKSWKTSTGQRRFRRFDAVQERRARGKRGHV